MQISQIYEVFLNCGMNVSTDTRTIQPGMLYIALKGENFNGNAYVIQALEKGALYALTEEDGFDDKRIIRVDDTLKTLQELAHYHRVMLKPRVIGIGGSNGKTTTKELLVSVLSTEYTVLSTAGNLNNHIGVPLTLLRLRREHQIAVIEMGANHEGDIMELCEIADPEFGLITNIGKEHLEGFGDLEGVARAECELFDYLLRKEGHAFVNYDDVWLKNSAQRLLSYSVYGRSISPVSEIQLAPSISFKFHDTMITSPLMGEHNLQNILATLSVAEHFKISRINSASGISSYKPINNRSQWVHTEKGNSILLDAYNANPSSVEMALKTFALLEGRKIVLLGDMFELGKHEASEHAAIATLCKELQFELVILVGNAFYNSVVSDSGIRTFHEKSQAVDFIKAEQISNSLLLIKGSRGMKMEEFLDLL